MSKISDERDRALEELADALDAIEHVQAVEQVGAHVVMSWVEYPGLRVGLDATGNAARVEFDPALDGWVAE